MLDCRRPRSNQIAKIKKQIVAWMSDSPKYEISSQASVLLDLLEKDFSSVIACPVQTLLTHIEDSGAWLPLDSEVLHSIIWELHEVGVLLLLGDYNRQNTHLILKISKLTNEVHESLFATTVVSELYKAYATLQNSPFDIGILPEDILHEILPPYITKEYLIHLQYCQQIHHSDIGIFTSKELNSPQSFLFFPALCCFDKSQVSWKEPSVKAFSIGWLALCTDIHDYFPPRFLHVLLLRLVYAFTLSIPTQLQTEHCSEHSRRCTMWKRGVHWLMSEGVNCMVELLNGSQGVVVLTNSTSERMEKCINVFNRIISCVMEAKAEFCYSIKPQFFLLDSTTEADYLNKDNMFAMSDVEKALTIPEGNDVIVSVTGRRQMEHSKLQCMCKLTHWNSLFPMEFSELLDLLKDIVREIYELGESLGASHGVLQAIEDNYPRDVNRRRRELVRWWMSSSPDPPCWWHLVQALKRIDENALAERIKREHGMSYHYCSNCINLSSSLLYRCSYSAARANSKPKEPNSETR